MFVGKFYTIPKIYCIEVQAMVVSHFISQGFELPAKEVMLKDLESKIEKAGGKSKVDTFLFTGFDYV